MQAWAEAVFMSVDSATAPPRNVEGLADAALMSAASAHPHTLPVTKATPNPTDSREEAAATAMG